jgi:hypothetical protein
MLPFFKRRIVLLFRRCDLPIQYGKITSRQVALLKPYGVRCRRFGYFSRLGDYVVTSKTSSLSFRPQGEILDPSHSFGMTTAVLGHCDTVSRARKKSLEREDGQH